MSYLKKGKHREAHNCEISANYFKWNYEKKLSLTFEKYSMEQKLTLWWKAQKNKIYNHDWFAKTYVGL